MKMISFEGSIGSGKTTLTNYFSHEFKAPKILERFGDNPFLHDFYVGNVDFETEVTFLMIHYYQIRSAMNKACDDFVFIDYSIEKDLVYARMNLNGKELALFEEIYAYVIENIAMPELVIYLDLSERVLKRRIFQRGREFEMNADIKYFDKFAEQNRKYFLHQSKSEVIHYDVGDLILEADDSKISSIKKAISQYLIPK